MYELVSVLQPFIQWEVGLVLRTEASRNRYRDPRQDVNDLVQHVFVTIFADDCTALRRWSPDGGRSLVRYLRWYAQQQTKMLLRSRNTNPWTEEPTEDGDLDALKEVRLSSQDLEAVAQNRDLLRQILARLPKEVSARQMRIFELLFVEQQSVDEVCIAMGMKRDAVYHARRRLNAATLRIAEEVLSIRSEMKPK